MDDGSSGGETRSGDTGGGGVWSVDGLVENARGGEKTSTVRRQPMSKQDLGKLGRWGWASIYRDWDLRPSPQAADPDSHAAFHSCLSALEALEAPKPLALIWWSVL